MENQDIPEVNIAIFMWYKTSKWRKYHASTNTVDKKFVPFIYTLDANTTE